MPVDPSSRLSVSTASFKSRTILEWHADAIVIPSREDKWVHGSSDFVRLVEGRVEA